MFNSYYSIVNIVDSVLAKDKPSLTDKIYLTFFIASSPPIRNYFFTKINTVDWFWWLNGLGYFSSEKAPVAKPADKKGYYTIPEWNVLPYLEKISRMDIKNASRKLLDIISVITKYSASNNHKLDNYRTWWYFVKILVNLPSVDIVEFLKSKNIDISKDWIREWIHSRFDIGLPSGEIAEKLLPKFLATCDDDIHIAEKILKELVEIKLKPMTMASKELLNQDNEYVTVVDQYWLQKAFQDNNEKIGKLCSKQLVYHIADKIKQMLLYESNRFSVDIAEDVYEVMISRVVGEDSIVKEYDFKCSINKITPPATDNKVKLTIFERHDRSRIELDSFSVESCLDLTSFVDRISTKVQENSEIKQACNEVEVKEKLAKLYGALYDDLSYIWLKSLDSNLELGITDAKEQLTMILKDILTVKCKNNEPEGKEILNKLITEYKFTIFKRIPLFIINKYWQEYKDILDIYFKEDLIENVIYKSDYENEMYDLFKNNIGSFAKYQKIRIGELIEAGHPVYRTDDNKQFMDSWKLRKYLPLKDVAEFKSRYEELVKKIGAEPKAPGKKFIRVMDHGDKSPLTAEEMMKMDTTKLIEDLNSFKGDKWEGPSEEGLANTLKSAVMQDPDRFVKDIVLFKNAKYLYVHNVLCGLAEGWKAKKEFDWKKVFDFAGEYINKPTFWDEAKAGQREEYLDTHVWVFNSFAELIEEGCKDDSWAFSEAYLDQANNLLDLMFNESKPAKEPSYPDPVSRAINTTIGKIIEAKILLMLRKVRLDNKKNIQKDDAYYSTQYDKLFKKGETTIDEAYTFFGRYMPNLFYLNRTWAEGKVKEVEGMSKDDPRWISFFQGYLSGGKVYVDLYEKMRFHYERALDLEFDNNYTRALLNHIAIGYIRGSEPLSDETKLFRKVIDRWQYKQLQEILSYLWMQRKYLNVKNDSEELKQIQESKIRIIDFWRWLFEREAIIRDKLKEDYPKFMSDLSRLTCLLDEINEENSKWLLQVAPHVGSDFSSPFFIESLEALTTKESAGYVGKIYIEMLASITPDYKKEVIQALVEKLYQYGNKADADKICNIYGSRGNESLRRIYDRYNK
ncbi:MAG: hypothetical protein WC490_04400 [Candidatus Margulisiibacteriota bacterium]